MIAGAAVKIISNYFLVGTIGIMGAPLSTVLCYLTAAVLNIFFTVKHVGALPNVKKIFGLPLFCGVTSVGLSALVYLLLDKVLPYKIATFFALLCIVFIYLFMIIRTKTVTESELIMLPHGKKMVKILKKLHFFTKKC